MPESVSLALYIVRTLEPGLLLEIEYLHEGYTREPPLIQCNAYKGNPEVLHVNLTLSPTLCCRGGIVTVADSLLVAIQ